MVFEKKLLVFMFIDIFFWRVYHLLERVARERRARFCEKLRQVTEATVLLLLLLLLLLYK